ncbi:glutathione S-transferase N-terminal domain-containing protein [Sorangium sp. So ce834]|uniref:glutathione S-transferase N-terminal domain-containing protein n=1 Tax=Sorangium sp. So ce834 TaxID=3133321 RepID=UPI003F5E0D27
MTELLGLVFSPWTEKARWALDVRRVPYTFRHYQPLVGEPALRVKLRRLTGRVSVPVLTADDGRVLADSADIARWADGRGAGPTLFPAEHEATIARLIDLSERALAAGRARALSRMLADDEALAEMAPGPIRRAHAALAARLGGLGVRRTLRKYGGHEDGAEAHLRTQVAALDELRATLARSVPSGDGPRTLLGRFTFADIAMSQVLVNVAPPAELKLGAASRRSFSDPELRDRYADLIAWRDELYRVFRTS